MSIYDEVVMSIIRPPRELYRISRLGTESDLVRAQELHSCQQTASGDNLPHLAWGHSRNEQIGRETVCELLLDQRATQGTPNHLSARQ